jgi:hypothetical protein
MQQKRKLLPWGLVARRKSKAKVCEAEACSQRAHPVFVSETMPGLILPLDPPSKWHISLTVVSSKVCIHGSFLVKTYVDERPVTLKPHNETENNDFLSSDVNLACQVDIFSGVD